MKKIWIYELYKGTIYFWVKNFFDYTKSKRNPQIFIIFFSFFSYTISSGNIFSQQNIKHWDLNIFYSLKFRFVLKNENNIYWNSEKKKNAPYITNYKVYILLSPNLITLYNFIFSFTNLRRRSETTFWSFVIVYFLLVFLRLILFFSTFL